MREGHIDQITGALKELHHEGRITVISTPEFGEGIYMVLVSPPRPSMLETLKSDPDYLDYLAKFQFQAWLAEQYRVLREQGLIRNKGESER